MSFLNKLRGSLAVITFLFIHNCLFAQDHVNSRLYFNNWKIVNPAAAGFHESQKFDINFASTFMNPSNVLLSWESKIIKPSSGVGLIFENYNFGLLSNVNASVLYNYQIDIDEKNTLSFGSNLNYISQTFDDTFDFQGDMDIAINDSYPASTFDIGLGVAYKSENFQGGVSFRNILESEIYPSYLDRPSKNTTGHLTAYAQYLFGDGNFYFIPSAFLDTNYERLYFDINPTFKLMNFILIGGGARFSGEYRSYNLRTGFDWQEKIQFSCIFYSTDYNSAVKNIEFGISINP
ncbi:PorP/SprF family type IX secretion system membrane protein [Marivirga sp.]|uniref:PorP/SprF family type IX secretion system membrane protein n=1 Tax=Marivirga sp. TaxID=2018662 RepID=UPI003DA79E88